MTNRQNWVVRASCRGLDPEMFFPERGKVPTEARRVCAACPVHDECFTYALTARIRIGYKAPYRHTKDDGLRGVFVTGVWAGTTDQQRRRIRRQRGLSRTA